MVVCCVVYRVKLRNFFEAISSFPLQVFLKTAFFVKRKKSFFGRFFSLTKNSRLLQKAFHSLNSYENMNQ